MHVLLGIMLIFTQLNFFRCDIPVVIMGETGCGKTRLIRYMCDLQTCDTGVDNLRMLKVIFYRQITKLLIFDYIGAWWNI